MYAAVAAAFLYADLYAAVAAAFLLQKFTAED